MNRTLALALFMGLSSVLAGGACAGTASPEVHLLFAGDVLLDAGPGKVVEEGGNVFSDFAVLLKEADLAIANLECPVATTGTAVDKIYTFRAHPRVVPVLARHFGAVSVANNHAVDYGREAFAETLGYLEKAGLPYFGGGRNLAQAHAPLILERKGLRIALLAFNGFKPRTFEALPDAPGVAWADEADILADIHAVRSRHQADIIIPFLHWGWERDPEPTAQQRELAHKMIDAGADIVVGNHPHVTQEAEYYRDHLIVYSLGNFVFDGFFTEDTRTGWLLRLTIGRDGLLRWDAVAAQQDEKGLPHPIPGAFTPCGTAETRKIDFCRNGKL
ncbi:MAG: CapA family protein [Alphaproteobacteria bacterium]